MFMNGPNELPSEPKDAQPQELDSALQELEAELRRLRPQSPSPELYRRIAAALQSGSVGSTDSVMPAASASQQKATAASSPEKTSALPGPICPSGTILPLSDAQTLPIEGQSPPPPEPKPAPEPGLAQPKPSMGEPIFIQKTFPIAKKKPERTPFWKSFGPVGRTAAALACCAVVLLGIWLWLHRDQGPAPSQKATSHGPPLVADSRKPSQNQTRIPDRPDTLAPTIQVHPWGQAQYRVLGPYRVRLDQGRLWVAAASDHGPEPFRVETPAGEVRLCPAEQSRGQAIRRPTSPWPTVGDQTASGATLGDLSVTGQTGGQEAPPKGTSPARPATEPRQMPAPLAGPLRAEVQFIVEVLPVVAGPNGSSPAGSQTVPSSAWNKESPQMNSRHPAAKWCTYVFVLAGLVQLANPAGSVSGGPGELLAAQPGSAPQKQVEKLAGQFARYYQPVSVQVKPAVPEYPLPVDISKVANAQDVLKKLRLSEEATDRLRQNGFVVVPMEALPGAIPPGLGANDIVKPYGALKRMEIPIFITSDTLLHLYRVQFDQTLMDIEQREFYPDMVALCTMLVDRFESAYAKAKDPLEKQSLAKGWVWAAVGRKCLQPDWEPAGPLARFVHEVMEKIDKHEGFWPPRETAYHEWPIFRYSEDFSQYVPRGHYTRSEELKRYFLAMMWFGRMTWLLKGEEPFGPQDQPALVPPAEAQAQTMAAAYTVRFLQEKLPDGRTGREVWQRIYTVTAFYVGFSDDLGVAEYEAALRKVLGPQMEVGQLADQKKFRQFQGELAKLGGPAIYGGTANIITYVGAEPERLVAALDKTTGFRLMGQRFVPDSYVLGRLVFPTVGPPRAGKQGMFTYVMAQIGPIRGFPRGLDVAAWLGSHRARHWLTQLGDDQYGAETDLRKGKNLQYDVVLEDLIAQFEHLSPADWNRNAYWSWLYALKALFQPYGKGYPTFMTTPAWQDKSMTTALASWAQLRHDTILYAKQSYTMAGGSAWMPKPVEGYVEPVPEFYARLLATTRLTLGGLKAMDALQPQAAERLEKLASLLEKLLAISQKELAHQELTKEEYDFIRNVSQQLQRIEVQDPELAKLYQQAAAQRDQKQLQKIMAEIEIRSGRSPMETTLIADVHTDANSQEVLQEGTGYVDLMVVCYLQPTGQGDGQLVLGAGPVLSYYEFRQPIQERLTDEKWIEMLRTGRAPKMPPWVETYRVEKLAPPPTPPGPIKQPPIPRKQ